MRNYIPLILALLLLTGCKQKTTIISENTAEDKEQKELQNSKELANSLMNIYMESENSPPGISIAISKNDSIIYARGFGYADIASKEMVTAKTQFRAASVSKIMTATAIAKLIQDNRLDLDNPIQDYVPEFPEKEHTITARGIAGHIAGMPHYAASDKIEKRFYGSVTESLKTFSHQKLLYEPGSDYNYSTHGYTLLTAAVEGASGVAFLEYLDKEIFSPLKMTSTGPHLINEEMEHMTTLYAMDQLGKVSVVEHPEDPSYKWGAGGMVSTPSDLVKMGNGYLNGFLQAEIVNEMFQSQKLTSGEETGVGIGWRSNRDPQGRRVFEHAGWMQGTRSVICVFPDHNLSIAMMSNTQRPYNVEETAHLLASLFLGNSSPKQQLFGKAEVLIAINNNDDSIETKGELILDGTNDRLVIVDGDGKLKTHKIIYLQRGDLYAVITTDGILFAAINLTNNKVVGKLIKYYSPQYSPATFDDPIISFEGQFTSE
ncbi:MAG: hypothetical protein COA50_00840 [Flavobacteriaceae bacterium]|nr:MAG: hypothetical protein COA50_00840 [Flavobacteriaceae bacterium]